jgi:hypothetical protein
MIHRLRKIFATLSVLSILVVSGVASAESTVHDAHHAHHQKATHSTILCSWMCTAGTGIDDAISPILTKPFFVGSSLVTYFSGVPDLPLAPAVSRGPPNS